MNMEDRIKHLEEEIVNLNARIKIIELREEAETKLFAALNPELIESERRHDALVRI